MAPAKTAARSASSIASARPYRTIPVPGGRKGRRRFGSAVRWMTLSFGPVAVLAAPVAVFGVSPTVRSWALDALGYGLIPTALWVASFALAMRYRVAWIKSFWRIWVASALLATVSLGIMSLFHASGGAMRDASLGGHWGQYIGGSPLPLGAVKIAALILLGPLLIFPGRAAPIYKRALGRGLRAGALSLMWLLARPRQYLRARALAGSSIEREDQDDSKFTQSRSIPRKKSLRSALGLQRAGQVADAAESLEPPTVEPEAISGGHGKSAQKMAPGWRLPSLELLSKVESRPISQTVLQRMAQHIEETLADHRVEVSVEDIRTGPRVIRFGLVPGWLKNYRDATGTKPRSGDSSAMDMSRVKVQSILMREKDLALALKTPYLRLEAPVPGESLVGLEVPNPQPRSVLLRAIAERPDFQRMASKGGIPVALGEDTGGESVISDLSDLPHLLIAGATGSGKSVCINSIVASLLLTNRPDRLRMLMVDPKRVELTPFNGIPHLIAPVIVDTGEVLRILRAIQNEMLRRYKLMEQVGVRNIEGYNFKAAEYMPYLVVIIDELADLMMASAYEVEQSLVRLAQLGRATGIHLILATQRPSVNVVTGLLKANIPSRIAFAVASQVDSRVILDSVGAERLLGKGDMLTLTSDSPRPKRVQGTFVHDREIEKLVEFWQKQSGPPLPEIPLDDQAESTVHEFEADESDLLDRARELAERFQHLSASVLQRRLRIGYSRATQLMELLEKEGISPQSATPR